MSDDREPMFAGIGDKQEVCMVSRKGSTCFSAVIA